MWEADKFKAWVQSASQMSIYSCYTSSMKQYLLVYCYRETIVRTFMKIIITFYHFEGIVVTHPLDMIHQHFLFFSSFLCDPLHQFAQN